MRYGLLALVLCICPASAETLPTQVDERLSLSQFEELQQGPSFGIADLSSARPINKISLTLIEQFEGWVPTAYDDPSGFCTIGYGHLIALKRCSTIDLASKNFDTQLDEAAGEKLLEGDTRIARVAVRKLVDSDINLNESEFGALVSFVFNVGKGNFQKSTLLKIINSGNKDHASKEFYRWVSSAGHVLSGLVQRRACEAALFDGNIALKKNGQIDVQSCSTLGAASDVSSTVDLLKGE